MDLASHIGKAAQGMTTRTKPEDLSCATIDAAEDVPRSTCED